MSIRFSIAIIALLGVAVWLYQNHSLSSPAEPPLYRESTMATDTPPEDLAPAVAVIGENLNIPWEIVFLPDGELLVTERPGTLVLLKAGERIPIAGVEAVGEGGLLGAALHPNFATNQYLYLYQTAQSERGLQNRIVRYLLTDGTLTFDRTILNNLPGARYHDGGRLAFGPDGYLYATVGDALRPNEAQNPNNLEGTIIRITDEGEPAPGNPFESAVYSYGHRNPQGLAWDAQGQLWSSEHGRSVGGSGFDELNLISVGQNYGWPDSQGDDVAQNTTPPIRHSTASVTWAPGGLAYYDGRLFMPGLRGETLYEAVLADGQIINWREHFVGTYGRLRTVQVGPDGMLYLLTSNRDGRANEVQPTDDRLIRVDPRQL